MKKLPAVPSTNHKVSMPHRLNFPCWPRHKSSAGSRSKKTGGAADFETAEDEDFAPEAESAAAPPAMPTASSRYAIADIISAVRSTQAKLAIPIKWGPICLWFIIPIYFLYSRSG
jgi:hypothetical protein